MPKILVSWVGNADLKASERSAPDDLGPVGQAVSSLGFDELVLLTNYSRDAGSKYLKWLKGITSVQADLRPVKLSSPTNYGEIYEAACDVVNAVLSRHESDPELTFHLSPGTPAMAAVWIILSKTRFPAGLIESSKEAGVRAVALPFDISAEFLPDLLRRPDERLESLTAAAAPEAPEFDDIIYRSKAMQQVIAVARRAAVRTVPILIEGESGTGKELLSRAIHRASPRRDSPFIPVNCGAIPAELIESELFGHERGAFTGAHQKRDGHFVKARGGTIFLDEVGELPLAAQVKLLRVIQENEITPVGSSTPRKIDVRVVSATNRHLIKEVARGSFREDLFYRLAVFVISLPPLRERSGDISPIIDKKLKELNAEQAVAERKTLSPGAKNLLLKHSWPGNVRELQNTLIRALVISSGERISEEDVRQAIFHLPANGDENVLNRPLGGKFNLSETLAQVARHYLQRALEESHGNKAAAAELVGLPSYQTLSNWLKKYLP